MDIELPARKTVEQALRDVGLSRRQAKRLVAVGWPALVGEAQAEIEELRSQLIDLTDKIALVSPPA